MIAVLQGILFESDADSATILCQGVGYQVFLHRRDLESLPELGTTLTLHTQNIVREDAHLLFGFQRKNEKRLFQQLIQVNSVGPRMAMNILSALSAAEFAAAVQQQNLIRLTAVSGVGKKTAERLVLDLKEKMLEFLTPAALLASPEISVPATSTFEEGISALTNLGYTPQEVRKAFQSIPAVHDLSLESLVKEGLKALS